jgi:hypothetical protein
MPAIFIAPADHRRLTQLPVHTLLVIITANIDLTRIFAFSLIRVPALGSAWEVRAGISP